MSRESEMAENSDLNLNAFWLVLEIRASGILVVLLWSLDK